ncbi:helix-turn-helix domain-containing protein [Virgibacillus sp. W0181]|uniref:helix-turn-helix domain-containing protein n=1 Tax=Virgibacillus sp. W0181 TaxID=3391581 RepID=UPI003F4809C6
MSVALLDQSKDDIQQAYEANSLTKIEKETLYVFDRVVHFMLSSFKNQLKGITFKSSELDFDEAYILSKKNMETMYKMLDFISQLHFPISDYDFGKIKVDIERWYYRIGGKGMYFEYQEDYLLTPKEAAELLGISNVTLHKYMKQGLEAIDTTSHHKIPKHAISLWQDPVYAIRMQMLTQEKKLQDQTPEERMKEVLEEITELQKEYKVKTVSEALAKYNIGDLDALDDPSDFRNWKDLEEEKEELLEELIGGSSFA